MKKDCIAKMTCVYESGMIEAVAYDSLGSEIGRTSLKTADKETRLWALPEKETVREGRLSYIRLKYADVHGITKPLERGIIKVSVEGGTLEGLGSACPFYERSYRSDEADTYYGEALAIVRAGSGQTVKVKASDGIHETEVVIPVEKDGQGGEA